MRAIVYDDAKKEVALVDDWPFEFERDTTVPIDSRSALQAIVRVNQVGVCNTDLEICKGYVPGFRHVLGHEGVGVVEKVIDTKTRVPVPDHELLGKRVVVEINCPCAEVGGRDEHGAGDAETSDSIKRALLDEVYFRNHFPRRTVLGIIARDGLMAERCLVPLDNCVEVPESLSDTEAAFSEPLAAAYRIVEQDICGGDKRIAVVGDGKLGLLIAHVLSMSGSNRVWHFGRHERKLDLVEGTERKLIVDNLPADALGSFDVAIEASGSPSGVQHALELLRPMGTLVMKTTCSLDADPESLPNWSALANDIVVNEKRVIGSRCGPQKEALRLLESDARTRKLVGRMVDRVYAFEEGLEALERARTRGSMKVMIRIAC